MCENTLALEGIARDISSIQKHLVKINGRLDNVETTTRDNKQDIAVITTRCQLVTHYTDEEIERLVSDQKDTEAKLWEWIKGNGVQLGNVGALLYLIGKASGWW